MTRAERHEAILALVAERGGVMIETLTAELGVSAATARRDLDALAQQQLLTRTRGGATAQQVAYDLPMRYKQHRRPAEKERIALAACELVPYGAVVGVSGGTTTTAIVSALMARADLSAASGEPSLTIVTNAVNIAAQLAMRPQFKVVTTGGVLHARSYELVGELTAAVLGAVSLDLAFIGANGVDAGTGATTHDEREAAVNRAMAARAARAVLVVDSGKLGVRAFATMGDATLFPTILTDAGVTADQRAALTDAGYEVVVA